MNAGKFIDRNPDLRAAGKLNIIEGASDSFKMYTEEEMASYMLRGKCQSALVTSRKNLQPVLPYVPTNEVSALLAPELQKSRFVAFREKFSENMYFSKPELGKSLPALTKPDDVTNESRTFGAKTLCHGELYEIVFPKKSPDEVNREYVKFHEGKIISHHRYLPSERINRHYKRPPFNPNDVYGRVGNVNKDGLMVKRCLQQCDTTVVISKVQKEFLERTQGALGKKIKSLSCNIDESMSMGHPRREDPCDVKSILENINPCVRNTALLDAIIHLNKLRRLIFNRHDLHINDLILALKQQDILNMGYLPLGAIIKVTGQLYLHIDAEKLHTALKHFHMLRDPEKSTECVDYNAFCKILQIQFPLPTTGTFTDMTKNVYNKDTTYRILCKDICNVIPEEANIVSPRTQRRNLIKTRVKMGDKTTAKILTSPDIPMTYGLEPSDFEKPRHRENLYRIFQRLLCEEKFNEVWLCATDLFEAPDNLFTVNEIRLAMDVVLGRTKPEILKPYEQNAKRKDRFQINLHSKNCVDKALDKSEAHEILNQAQEQRPADKEAIDKQAGGDVTMNIENNVQPIDVKIKV